MSNAYEVTTDDVIAIISLTSVDSRRIEDELANRIHGLLDHSDIEAAALSSTDWDEQFDNAFNEMNDQIRQLIQDGELPELEGVAWINR